MLTRRELMKRGALGGAGLVVSRGLLTGSALGDAPVARSLKPYVDPMPLLVDNAIDATGGGTHNLTAALISRKVHRDLPATTLFGYLRSGGPGTSDPVAPYIGPAIVAKTGVPITVNYRNNQVPIDFRRALTYR